MAKFFSDFIAKLCLGGLLLSALVLASSTHIVPKKPLRTVNTKDPVGVFCGTDCSNCNFNVKKCYALVKSNIGGFCDASSGKNCYSTWLKYSKTCEYLCAGSHKSLAGAENLINITFIDEELAL